MKKNYIDRRKVDLGKRWCEMIYLDNAATTKPNKAVIEAINRCLTDNWGNPSSLHWMGTEAKFSVDRARETVAGLIGAKAKEIIFTSGACESNSHAICGYLKANESGFITTGIEHSSIANIADDYGAIIIPVDKDGLVDMGYLENALMSNQNALVSIQYANNEIGTVQDMNTVANIVHRYGGVLHTDATQIIPDRPIAVKNIDMMSFSGQKIGATKGIGILYVRDGVEIKPIIYGSQEKSRRGGTENVPYIAGLSAAVKDISYPDGKNRDYFVQRVLEGFDCYLVGSPIGDMRLKNNASICFKGIEAESLMLLLNQKGIYVSTGSACSSGSLKPSRVLEKIGLPEQDLHSVVRFSFGDQTIDDVDFVIHEIKQSLDFLKKISGNI